MLARCAGKDKYYSLVESLFEQTGKWVVPNPLPPLFAIAKQAGFTQQTFDECLANQKLLDGIEEVRKRAADKFKIQSTPTFFINGERLVGAQPFAEFEKVIDKNLKS
jgi:protein-disulfide isomerase